MGIAGLNLRFNKKAKTNVEKIFSDVITEEIFFKLWPGLMTFNNKKMDSLSTLVLTFLLIHTMYNIYPINIY